MRAAGVIALWLVLVPASAGAQGYLDRTRAVVAGRVIMDSDITIARKLKLVPESVTNDEAQTQVALENRLLILAEIRGPSFTPPTDEEVAARRQQLEASFGPGESLPALMAEQHMSEAELVTWLREDVRIQKYLRDRFGREPNPDAAVKDWVRELRKRAGLK